MDENHKINLITNSILKTIINTFKMACGLGLGLGSWGAAGLAAPLAGLGYNGLAAAAPLAGLGLGSWGHAGLGLGGCGSAAGLW